MSVKESDAPIQNSVDFHKLYNFDFLALYKKYYQNYFAINRFIKLESFIIHLQHSRPCVSDNTTLTEFVSGL